MSAVAPSRVEQNTLRRIGVHAPLACEQAAVRLRSICDAERVPFSLCHALSRDYAREAPSDRFCRQYSDDERRRALACLSAASGAADWAAEARRIDAARVREPKSRAARTADALVLGSLASLGPFTGALAGWCAFAASRAWFAPEPPDSPLEAPALGLAALLAGSISLGAARLWSPLRALLSPSDEAVRQDADFVFLRTLVATNEARHGSGRLDAPPSPMSFESAGWPGWS